VFNQLGSIARWLFNDWARWTDGVKDRRNPQRSPSSQFWKEAGENMANSLDGFEERRRVPKRDPSLKKVEQQALGNLASWFAVKGMVPIDVPSAMQYFVSTLTPAKQAEFMAKVEERTLQFEQLMEDLSKGARPDDVDQPPSES